MRKLHIPARYRSAARRKKRLRRLPLVMLLAVLLGVGAIFSEWGLSSISPELTEEAARGHLLTCIQKAVDHALAGQESPFTQASCDSQGRVTAVSADAGALNRLKGDILEELEHSLNGRASVGVPVGSLTNIALLNGRGFSVPVRLNFEGSADVSFQTELLPAGINQSCHRITMTVRAQVYSQSKRFAVSAQESTATVLAETLVVGEVPQAAVLRSS